MSFFKPQVSFPLNFASPFSAITLNSSENFQYLQKIQAYISITTQLTTFYCYSTTNSTTNLSSKQLFFTQFKNGYHPIIYPICTLIPSPLFVKKPYTSPFTMSREYLGSTMYIKAYFLNKCSTTKLTNSEKQNENYDRNYNLKTF